ncbi:hypothetical protein CPB86DRAFT_777109 [Serendipita vermifera]|nr:hypothetical protein CPB86DRAFT_777109 [Serendipita vermifera]
MFSGIYGAINPLFPSDSSSPQGSSPSESASDQPDSKSNEVGYSTYQRRTKPSLEDRLKASLAAKEQKKNAQEKGDSPLSSASLPQMRPSQSQESKSRDHAPVREAWNVPLPSSPPQNKQLPTQPSLVIPYLAVISPPHGDTEPPNSPTKTQESSPFHSALADPLSPILPSTPPKQEIQEHVQELPLPSPAYDDPLTPAFLELEKERQAAAARARLPRSPPPPSPQQKQHGRSKSAAINKPMVPEGEPFIRFGSSPLSSRPSLEHLLKGTSIFEGLGLEGVHDAETLREWIDVTKKKSENAQDEIGKLQSRLQQQESRMEELRDTHRLATLSQSELIDSLRQQVSGLEGQINSLETNLAVERSVLSAERSTRDSLIAAERAKSSTNSADLEGLKAKLKEMSDENEKLKGIAKEEEEKRTKAITLLKTVRTKLVKAEKDRDDLQKEFAAYRENEMAGEKKGEEELNFLRNERNRLITDLETLRVESMREMDRIREENRREFERRRAQLEAEVNAIKESMDRDVLARRGEWEIEGMAMKTAHQKEVTNLNSRIAALNTSLSKITEEKQALFADLQLKQSEIETSRTQIEDLQSQITESSYQLREREDQITMMQLELTAAKRHAGSSGSGNTSSRSNGPQSTELAKRLAEVESRSEAKITELNTRLKVAETERTEQEERWAKTLASRGEEIERLRNLISLQEKEGRIAGDYKAKRDKDVEALENKIRQLETDKLDEKRKGRELMLELDMLKDKLETKGFEVTDLQSRIDSVNAALDEVKAKESQLKASNKTLREELRKVQSSAALLERQRNPGVGYWSANNPRTPVGTSFGDGLSGSTPDLSRTLSNGRPGTPTGSATPVSATVPVHPTGTGSARSSMEVSTSVQGEDEINYEYLRNVILQFLEHKEMRPNLVRVMAAILRFTPQETRRLIAKAGT